MDGFIKIVNAAAKLALSASICIMLFGCQTTPTKWVDISGTGRGSNQFEMDKASCNQLAYSSGAQAESSDSNSCYSKTCGFLRIAAVEITAAQSFKDCMTARGWRLESQVPVKQQVQKEQQQSYMTWQATGHVKHYGWFTIPRHFWTESSPGQPTAEVSVEDNKVYLHMNGWIHADIIVDYKSPVHLGSIPEPVMSVLISQTFGCQLSNGHVDLVQYFSGGGLHGAMLKSVTYINRNFPMSGNNSAGQMRKYVCAEIGYF